MAANRPTNFNVFGLNETFGGFRSDRWPTRAQLRASTVASLVKPATVACAFDSGAGLNRFVTTSVIDEMDPGGCTVSWARVHFEKTRMILGPNMEAVTKEGNNIPGLLQAAGTQQPSNEQMKTVKRTQQALNHPEQLLNMTKDLEEMAMNERRIRIAAQVREKALIDQLGTVGALIQHGEHKVIARFREITAAMEREKQAASQEISQWKSRVTALEGDLLL
ncbi:hypothetical protein BJ742DRAFT_775611 [Cladochytrium replicatum]|nr:hypothetical protein BJ742DRAFT_775611 [Cladochytrium replicatum]